MIWFILFIIILVVGCYCTYQTAEVHELHKMRAAFEDKKHVIEAIINAHKGDLSFESDYYKGEIHEIEELEQIIDKELEDKKIFDLDR